MSINKTKNSDYSSLSSSKKKDDKENHAQSTLKPSQKSNESNDNIVENSEQKLVNYNKQQVQRIVPHHSADGESKTESAENSILEQKKSANEKEESLAEIENQDFTKDEAEYFPIIEEDYATELKQRKKKVRAKKDFDILKNESWVVRNGHFLTYMGLYCFSVLVFFRPYELVPGLGFLSATAFYVAMATLFIYLPTQLATEGSLTTFSTEVKCVLIITILALMTIPIARSPALAWEEFNDSFSKAVIMFVVMVNVLRTRQRLMGIVWISLGIGIVLSYMALGMYMRGEISVEGYRVAVEIGGMFGNPNELALHLVIMTPIAIALGLGAKSKVMKYIYFIAASMFIAGNVVTYSRGGFLGLLALSAVLIWKLGKQQRMKIFAISGFIFAIFVALAPGEYGQRIFSIFDSSLDAVGSSNQRTELLKRSIIVSLRNPWGIGIGNFPIVGQQHLGTHNSFTEVSSELGILGFLSYMIFMISPFRKLGAIERRLHEKEQTRWFYYLAVGLQASIVGYLVSSFFAAVAYNWFIYYLIAYAVAFRRIYLIEEGLEEEDVQASSITENLFGWQVKST